MAKKQEYVPQFDLDCLPDNSKIKYKTCQKCGKQSVSLHDGVCFDCRQKQNATNAKEKASAKAKPDEQLFNQWNDQKTEKNTTPFLMGLLWKPIRKYGVAAIFIANGLVWLLNSTVEIGYGVIGIISLILGIVLIGIFKKLRHNKFVKFNSQEVDVSYGSTWICPSCDTVNDKLQHCEKCGVLPKFKQYDNLQ